jgi:hypothetical protein
VNQEFFLNPSQSGGIDALYAWGFSRGEGQRLIDFEEGWDLTHPDLPVGSITLRNGVNTGDIDHGTNVLGVICALDDGAGVTGVAPGVHAVDLVSGTGRAVRIRGERAALHLIRRSPAVSTWAMPPDRGRAGALARIRGVDHYGMPLETTYHLFDLIRTITALGTSSRRQRTKHTGTVGWPSAGRS